MSDHRLWAPDAIEARLRDTRLRVLLRVNAAFSAVAGIARGGKDWTETCTLWEPGHRHAVEVDPDGYPFPLATVGCLSYVEPDPRGRHRVGLVFQLQPKAGLAGHLMVLVMDLGRPILHRIHRRLRHRTSPHHTPPQSVRRRWP